MERQIVKSKLALRMPSEEATADDLPLAQDLLDTLAAHAHECVGLAANMVGIRKRVIAFEGDEWYGVNTSFLAEDWSGEPRVNDAESVRLKWVRPEDMPETLVRSHREILRDYLQMQKNE